MKVSNGLSSPSWLEAIVAVVVAIVVVMLLFGEMQDTHQESRPREEEWHAHKRCFFVVCGTGNRAEEPNGGCLTYYY